MPSFERTVTVGPVQHFVDVLKAGLATHAIPGTPVMLNLRKQGPDPQG